jgi:hypothetical protein
MRKLTNKLFISILTVAFAVIALGTTTFAWFTLSNTATVSPFNASVTAGEGIEVSLDETNWYTTLSETVINAYLFDVSRYTTNFKLDLVTSTDGIAFELLDGTDVLPAARSKYLQFTLYFRSFGATAPSIYWNSATLTSTGIEWQPDAPFNDSVAGVQVALDSEESPVMRYAANATRIAVKGSAAPVIYELASNFDIDEDLTGDGNTVLGARAVGAIDDLVDGAISYYTAKTGFPPENDELASVPATVTDPATLDSASLVTLTGVAGDWEGSITVTIWVEGWDQNAFNAILKDVLTIGLVFGTSNL